jgi:hypothetical protein
LRQDAPSVDVVDLPGGGTVAVGAALNAQGRLNLSAGSLSTSIPVTGGRLLSAHIVSGSGEPALLAVGDELTDYVRLVRKGAPVVASGTAAELAATALVGHQVHVIATDEIAWLGFAALALPVGPVSDWEIEFFKIDQAESGADNPDQVSESAEPEPEVDPSSVKLVSLGRFPIP